MIGSTSSGEAALLRCSRNASTALRATLPSQCFSIKTSPALFRINRLGNMALELLRREPLPASLASFLRAHAESSGAAKLAK